MKLLFVSTAFINVRPVEDRASLRAKPSETSSKPMQKRTKENRNFLRSGTIHHTSPLSKKKYCHLNHAQCHRHGNND